MWEIVFLVLLMYITSFSHGKLYVIRPAYVPNVTSCPKAINAQIIEKTEKGISLSLYAHIALHLHLRFFFHII